MGKTWTLESWKNQTAAQQPDWSDTETYDKVIQEITKYPPLVFAEEVRALKQYLAEAAQGKGFLIQGGDCAETFIDFNADMIENKLKTLLQMSAIIQYITKTNIIRIGRIAGQFFKPRTSEFEIRNNNKLPAESNKNNDIKSLSYWLSDQRKNYKNQNGKID